MLRLICYTCGVVNCVADLQAAATAAAARSLAAAALVAASAAAALAVAAPAAVVDLESRHATKHCLQTACLNSEPNIACRAHSGADCAGFMLLSSSAQEALHQIIWRSARQRCLRACCAE